MTALCFEDCPDLGPAVPFLSLPNTPVVPLRPALARAGNPSPEPQPACATPTPQPQGRLSTDVPGLGQLAADPVLSPPSGVSRSFAK